MPPSVPMDSSGPMAAPILESLVGIRRKARVLSIMFGIGVVLAAAVWLILITVFLDYLLNLPTSPRFVFVMGSVAGTVYALVHWVIRPFLIRLSLGDVAGRLENVFPQFDDRLRSTVDFVRGEIDASSMMKQRVITEAGRLTESVNLDNALVKKPVLYSMSIGIGAIALAVVLGVVFSEYARIAGNRLLLGSDRYPRRVQISVVKELPTKIAAGQRMDLRMKLVKGDKPSMQPIVYYKYDDGSVQKQIM